MKHHRVQQLPPRAIFVLIMTFVIVGIVTFEAGVWGLLLLGLVLGETYRLIWGQPRNDHEGSQLATEEPGDRPPEQEKQMRNYSDLDTTTLVRLAQDGDRSALAVVVQRETPYLLRYATAFSRSLPFPPSELVQMAWVKILLGLPAVHDPAYFRTWSTTVLQNEAIKASKRLRATDELVESHGPDAATLVRQSIALDAVLEDYDARRMLRWLADHVDSETATIAVLRGLGGLKWKDTEREMNLRHPQGAPWTKSKCEARIKKITNAQAKTLRRLLGGREQ